MVGFWATFGDLQRLYRVCYIDGLVDVFMRVVLQGYGSFQGA